MNIDTNIRLMKSHLKPLGLSLPDDITNPTPGIELPDVSAQDVVDAIRKHGFTRATLDTATKYYLAGDKELVNLIRTSDEDARREAYGEYLPELRDKLKAEYAKAAETITEHAPRFAANDDLDAIPASSLVNNETHSAWVALHGALRRAEQIGKAWRGAQTVDAGNPFPSRPEQMILVTGHPTPEAYWKHINTNFDSYRSIWGQARAGWTLALATPNEVQERYNTIMAGRPEPVDPMRGVSFL